jgi:drug/metabolite transporter (DMT)-like permease
MPMKTLLVTVAAMIALAANSVFCRAALGPGLIDAVGFSSIRLASGATMLILILWLKQPRSMKPGFDPIASIMLATYAFSFSYAYLQLSTGTGALILFGVVQLTLILMGLFKGERPRALAWLGMTIAIAGLVYLLLPGISAPPIIAAMLMAIAGIAWGFYTLRGSRSTNATAATTWNFVGTLPLVVLALLLSGSHMHWDNFDGVVLAVLSGALASGLGYVLWYAALPGLTLTQAANIQIPIPVIAAFGGVLFMGEHLTTRLIIASLLTLGGIAMVISARKPKTGR